MAKRTRRHDGRRADALRPVRFRPDFVRTADGACLIEMGGTRIICTASVADGVPRWRNGTGLGWVTAEYGMLPASTQKRKPRPTERRDSRSVEIQRIIGRVLRNVVRFDRLGVRTVYLDCDVLEADGGTRTAAINGAFVAMARALAKLEADGQVARGCVCGGVAAVSVGIVEGKAVLDLDYAEDSAAEVDMCVAMTGGGKFVEVQGTSEGGPFGRDALDRMLRLARRGIGRILRLQREAVKGGSGR